MHTPLDEADVEAAAARLRDDGVEAVAIGFLHAYANPQHEQRASELTRAVMPEAYVTSSHEILPVWREYERFSTTVVSAYCGPIVERYLRSLEARLREAGFRGQHLLMMLGRAGRDDRLLHPARGLSHRLGPGGSAGRCAPRRPRHR